MGLTNDPKSLASLKSLVKADWGADAVHVGKHAAYVWCENGILESKAVVATMGGLGASGTSRNWATLEKISGLLREAD